MAQIISNEYGNVAGRIGKGFGKSLSEGLAEQIPKEADRYRLSQGLKELGKKKNNDVWENFTELAALPGSNPQITESGTRLLQQRARGNALAANKQPEKPSPFPKTQTNEENQPSKIPSLTTEETSAKNQEGYIGRTQDQIISDAGRKYNENPALFGNDPDKAIANEEQAETKNRQIATDYQTKHQNLTHIQDNVVDRLGDQASKLGVKVPGNVFSDISDKAVQATKPKKEGGRGLTEQQAMKEYGKELDDASREYQSLKSQGDWSVITRKSEATRNAFKSVQQDFKKRNDLENLADTLIAENGLSANKAYYLAYPPSDYKEVNNILAKIPKNSGAKLTKNMGIPDEQDVEKKTLIASEALAPMMKLEGASPLSIAAELKSKGLDPQIWLNYLDKNRNKLNLSERQGRELSKPRDFVNTMNDFWLFGFSGLDKLVEQE